MKDIVERIVKGIHKEEHISIYSKDSIDDVISVSICMLFIKYFKGSVSYHLESMGRIIEENILTNPTFSNTKLIIALGFGEESESAVDILRKYGKDTLLINNSIKLNNNSKDNDISLSGLAYKVAESLGDYYKINSVKKYVDLSMLGILASNSIIIGENKKIVIDGLKKLKETKNIGILALAKVSNLDLNRSESVDNIINLILSKNKALSNIDNAKIIIELLTTVDENRALQIVKYLRRFSEKDNLLSKITIYDLNI